MGGVKWNAVWPKEVYGSTMVTALANPVSARTSDDGRIAFVEGQFGPDFARLDSKGIYEIK